MNQTGSNKKAVEMTSDGIQINLEGVLKAVRKFGWVCFVLAIVFGGFAFAKAQVSYVPRYTAEATFTVSTQNNSSTIGGVSVYSFYYDAATANQLTETFPLILNSNVLQDVVCEDMELPRMPATLSAKAVEGSNMFTIYATGTDPRMTYNVLLSVIENYPSVAKYVVGNIRIEMITAPVIPTAPSNTNDYITQVIQWALMGFAIGCAIVLLYAYQRNTISNKSEIKSNLGYETLGTIPRVFFKKHTRAIDCSVLYTNKKVDETFLESVRVFRNVFKNSLKSDDKVIIGTSTAPGEGKTTVITNLALSLSDHDKKVLLVDADLRNPSVAALLGINPEYLDFKIVTDRYKIAYIKEYGIYFMLFNVEEGKTFKYMNSSYVKEIFDSVRDSFDYVLVDTPPCGLVSDALFFAQAADAAFYVVLNDAIRVTKIKSGLDNLMSTDIKILGCVLNGTISAHGGYGYGRHYGYGYGYRYGYGYGYGKKKKHRR